MSVKRKEINTDFLFPKAKGIVVSGDIHGDFNALVYKCCIQYEMKDTLIIVAGDCGFGFERQGYYENLYKRNRERLSKANNWLVMIRGNHDNPAYFNDYPIHHTRWMTLPDYSVIKACGHTILCLGGATSIDRTYRMDSQYYHLPQKDKPLEPSTYWHGEQPVFDMAKLDAVNEKCAIDTVVSHTAPSFCQLISHNFLNVWATHDEALIEDVKKERIVMDRLYNYLIYMNHPLRYWFYGHFHQSWHQELDEVQYNMLDIMELRELMPLT